MARCFRVDIVDCYIAVLIVVAELNTPAGGALHLTMASILYDTDTSGTMNFTCFRSKPPSSGTALNFGNPFSVRFENRTIQESQRTLPGDQFQSDDGLADSISSNAFVNATGLFTCEVSNGNSSASVYSITHIRKGPVNGFYFNSGTHMVNAGENLTLFILSTSTDVIENSRQLFRVRNNLIDFITEKGNLVISIPHNEVQHGDLYGVRRYDDYDAASMIRIIVRDCSDGQWGPPACTGVCNQCYNGGVCDDKTGECICAPGFSGTNCSNACGKHKFGLECEFECGQGLPVRSCTGTQFSLPDPYGSSCISGYSGRDCNSACPNGTYGAGCTQTCHCLKSDTCDRYTGACADQPDPYPYTLLIVVSSVSGVFLIVLLLTLINECCHRLGHKSETLVANTEMPQFSRSVPSPILAHEDDPIRYENFAVGIPSWAMHLYVERESVGFGSNILSLGCFGEVTDGSVTKNGEVYEATISTLKASVSAEEHNKFMTAFSSMIQVGNHPNLVNILGVCSHDDDLCVALEFMPYGNLRSHLRRTRSAINGTFPSSETLLQYALDVAKGMQHLATNKIVHQDLATRNVLLDRNLVAKISDFGLSRVENTYLETTAFQKRVSFRWKPLEALNAGTCSSKTDVWSFGVLLWEIATLGATPYSATPTNMLTSKLKSGYRLPKPSYCDPEIYELMQQCWHVSPQERPSFRTLVEILSVMRTKKKYIRLSSSQEAPRFEEIRQEFDDN